MEVIVVSGSNGDLQASFENGYIHSASVSIYGSSDVSVKEAPNTQPMVVNQSIIDGDMLNTNYDTQIISFEGSMGNFTPSGLNIAMFDNIGGTGDGISILDEGNVLKGKTKEINFIGEGVTATVTLDNRLNLTFTGEVTEINWTQQKW